MVEDASIRTVRVEAGESPLDFHAAKARADALASETLDDPVCLSWYDRAEDRESPAHVGECPVASVESQVGFARVFIRSVTRKALV